MIKQYEDFTVEENTIIEGDYKVLTNMEGYEYRILFVTDKEGKTRIFMTDNFSISNVLLTNIVPSNYEIDFEYPDLGFTLGEIYDNNITNFSTPIELIEEILDVESFEKIKKLLFTN